jgi:hypothetical protein
MAVIQDGLALSIHDGDKAVVSAKVSSVVEDILDCGEIGIALWNLLEPMIFDLFDLGGAMTREFGKSSDGVAFLNPEPEPRKLITFFDIKPFPNKSLPALPASETLLVTFGKSIKPNIA